MADPPQRGAGGPAIKTNPATARKHLRIGQAATRSKHRSSAVPGDSGKERQVSMKLGLSLTRLACNYELRLRFTWYTKFAVEQDFQLISIATLCLSLGQRPRATITIKH